MTERARRLETTISAQREPEKALFFIGLLPYFSAGIKTRDEKGFSVHIPLFNRGCMSDACCAHHFHFIAAPCGRLAVHHFAVKTLCLRKSLTGCETAGSHFIQRPQTNCKSLLFLLSIIHICAAALKK